MPTWPLQSACDSFYGNPRGPGGDDASEAWQKANLVYVTAPWPLRMGDIKLSRGIRVHRKVADSLRRVLDDIWQRVGQDLAEIRRIGMDDTGGGFNYRVMRGGSALSMHSWGCAVDFDPGRNGLGDSTPAMDHRVIAAFEAEGWEWGGHWSRCDGMHFQAAWTRANPPRLSGAQAPKAAQPAPYEVRALQSRLQELGYTEVGNVDGKMGGRTAAALAAFQHDNSLPITGKPDDATRAALATALPRDIAPERANTTATDLKNAGNPIVTAGVSLKRAATLTGGGAGLLGLADITSDPIGAAQSAADKVNQAQGIAGQFKGFGATVLQWAGAHPVLCCAIVGVCIAGFFWFGADKAISAAVARHRSGADTGL